jgi:hypothetical protein
VAEAQLAYILIVLPEHETHRCDHDRKYVVDTVVLIVVAEPLLKPTAIFAVEASRLSVNEFKILVWGLVVVGRLINANSA